MGVKAVFYMKTYNTPEKYIRRAIESVLNQTESHLLLLIRDNGTTDNTNIILQEYAEKDDRVIVYRNEENHNFTDAEYELQTSIFKKYVLDDNAKYFVSIDSDDYYDLDFLEKAYKKAKETNADLVVYGNKFIDEKTEEVLGERVPKKLVVKNKNIEAENFELIYASIRPLWAKIYSCKWWNRFFELLDFEVFKKIKNGADTYIMLTLLKEMENIHFVDDVVYNYIVRKNSIYHSNFDTLRLKSGEVLFNKGMELLEEWNINTEKTLPVLLAIYRGHISELLDLFLLNNNNNELDGKLQYIKNILNDSFFTYVCENNNIFLDDIYKVLLKFLKSNANNIDEFIRLLNSEITDNIKELFNVTSICIEENELNSAGAALRTLQRSVPLNKNIIYLKIVLEVKQNNIKSIVLYSEVAKAFFFNDKELMELVNSIKFYD